MPPACPHARVSLLCLPICVVMILSTGALWGQEVTGDLEGAVVSPDGVPLSGAEVTALSPILQGPRTARTDSEGRFRILLLPVGAYRVELRHPDFQPATAEPVVIRLGRTTAIPPIPLKRKFVLEEHVEVTAPKPLLDPVSTTGGGNLPSEYFEALPVDRNYTSIATLLPGVDVELTSGTEPNFGGGNGSGESLFH